MKLFSLLLFFGVPLCGQLSYGVIAGVPFTDLTNGFSASSQFATIKSIDQSGRYTIGPTVQLGLPLGFRVEADALYRPAAFSVGTSNYSSAQWRFPVLLQYRLSFPVVKPFVEAGYSYDHLNVAGSIPASLSSLPTVSPALSITSHHGFVIGAGLDLKVPFVHISPEFRYTRDVGGESFLNSNQAEFLVGVRF